MGLSPLDEVELTCQSIEDEERALITSSNAIDDTSTSKEDEPMKEEKGKPTESSPSTNKEPDSAMAIGEDSMPVEISFNNVGETDSESFKGEEEEKPRKSSPISVAPQSVSNNGDETLTTKSSKKIDGVVILMV